MNAKAMQAAMRRLGAKARRFAAGGIFLFALALPVSMPPAEAQEAVANGLFGVKEILARAVRFDEPKVAASCRLVGKELDEAIAKEMRDAGLPVIMEDDARPTLTDAARINLVPQIVPYNSQGTDCITWVALSAESHGHVRIPPVDIPRAITVDYWRHGELVVSAQSVHADHVETSLQNMIRQFAQQYKNAQPPTVGRPHTPAPH